MKDMNLEVDKRPTWMDHYLVRHIPNKKDQLVRNPDFRQWIGVEQFPLYGLKAQETKNTEVTCYLCQGIKRRRIDRSLFPIKDQFNVSTYCPQCFGTGKMKIA